MRFYHGGTQAIESIDPLQLGVDGELLCASASVNVARRYGDVITAFELETSHTITCTVQEWFSFTGPASLDIAHIREQQPKVGAVIVKADRATFDFPADTVFVVQPDALAFVGVLTAREILDLDDGLSCSHELSDRSAPDWSTYVQDVCGGEEPGPVIDVVNTAKPALSAIRRC